MKRTQINRGPSQLKRTPIKARSDERSKFMKEDRVPLITALVEAGFICAIGPTLRHFGVPGSENCTVGVQGLHERRKRSAGGSLVNHQNLVPACNWCNSFIEDNPNEVRELTGDLLVVREGDAEWDVLGKRNDP